jgi:HNH endonuclease
MASSLIRQVWRRAGGVCEYCRMPQAFDDLPCEVDHIIARKHLGRTVPENLALSCFYCNTYKGPNVAGIDPATGAVVRLFHPRRHRRSRHFRWDGPLLRGRTPVGRAPIAVLEVNRPGRVALRAALIEDGVFPP